MPDEDFDQDKTVVWNIRVKEAFDELVEDAVKKGAHSSKSEFVRQAVRKELERAGTPVTTGPA